MSSHSDPSRRLDYLDLAVPLETADENDPFKDVDYLDLARPVSTKGKVGESTDTAEWTIEGLTIAIHAKNLKKLKDDSVEVYQQLGKLMADNTLIRKLIGSINAATDNQGNVDLDQIPDLEATLEAMRKDGIDLPPMEGKLTAEKRMRLLDNLKMSVDTNNIEINMSTNKINNLHFTLQESYQWMRSHLKTLDETKKKIISNIAPR